MNGSVERRSTRPSVTAAARKSCVVASDHRIGVSSFPVARLKVREEPGGGVTAALEAGDYGLAMELLLIQHGDCIYGYCRRFLGNTIEAEDVSQTVFAQAFQD